MIIEGPISKQRRKLIYIMTKKPVWIHTKCINKKSKLPIWYEPFWIHGICDLCEMTIDREDYWCNYSYNQSQRKLFDNIDLNLYNWYSN